MVNKKEYTAKSKKKKKKKKQREIDGKKTNINVKAVEGDQIHAIDCLNIEINYKVILISRRKEFIIQLMTCKRT